MHASSFHPRPAGSRADVLREAVDHAAHLLPAQGPIGVFIHHNTLHAFQHLPFEEAVVAAARTYGAEPFMREEAFREQMAQGRILERDLAAVVDEEPNEVILPGLLDRRMLRTRLLTNGVSEFEASTVHWVLEETGALDSGGKRLLDACCEYADGTPHAEGSGEQVARPREGLQRLTGVDLDRVIHPLLIRLSGVFLDQGVAYWPMPNRKLGFLQAVRLLFSEGWTIFPEYLDGLDRFFRDPEQLSAEAAVLDALDRFGVPEEEWGDFLRAELLALPGWAGIMHCLEADPSLAPHVRVPCSLMEFLAVRLGLELVAASNLCRQKGYSLTAWKGAAGATAPAEAQRRANAATLGDAIRKLGISAEEFSSWNPVLRRKLAAEIRGFDGLERRRLYHLAYERHHEQDVLQALALYRREHADTKPGSRPLADVFFCIDEREESTRRHLEEVAPEIRTHGAAGFFGVAMDYAGIDDAHGVALCPVVVKPQHAVREKASSGHGEAHEVRVRRRRTWSRMARHTYISSRSLLRGWVSTTSLWPPALVQLVARVVAPGRYGQWEKRLHGSLIPQPSTELAFGREESSAHAEGAHAEGLFPGFTLNEMVDRIGGTLTNAGMRSGFARLVMILGHGSTSLNNPHESAHDCGACGGRRGGPNGRIFAAMANHPEVRVGLEARGLKIPDDTWFVGGYHDTCNDDVTLSDLEQVPETHRAELTQVRELLEQACARDAQERVRRFEAAAPRGSAAQALRHVQDRAHRLSEPRPEYGHCTNAVCVVGRRGLTRGLFLDRRAFLVSYDATQDPQDEALARQLGAVVPVCGGISLEYYFSFVDNERYGCGTKLPHNITGLIGVMNGHASDLRTGLPWQMVEIHEPVRILFVVETTPERVTKVMAANPVISEFLENRWIRLATIDPANGEVHVRRGDAFEKLEAVPAALPAARSSADWFLGHLGHLPIARITSEAA